LEVTQELCFQVNFSQFKWYTECMLVQGQCFQYNL